MKKFSVMKKGKLIRNFFGKEKVHDKYVFKKFFYNYVTSPWLALLGAMGPKVRKFLSNLIIELCPIRPKDSNMILKNIVTVKTR